MGTHIFFYYSFILHEMNEKTLGILKYIAGHIKGEPKILPDHDFFDNFRWDMILTYEGKCEFLEQGVNFPSGFKASGDYFLHGHSWIMDQDNLINLFLVWLHPYIKYGVAFSLYDVETEDVIQRYPFLEDN